MENPVLLRRAFLKGFTRVGLILGLLLLVSPLWAYSEGPFQGKVIDAETKEPLEGAVVVVIWHKTAFPETGGHGEKFVEAYEALTDKKGEFTLPAFSSLDPLIKKPRFRIFKPGYGSYPRFHKKPLENFERHFRDYTIVELPKLKTREERVKVYRDICLGLARVPDQKIPNVVRFNTIEAKELGFIQEGEIEECFSPAR